ncbi:hypothetical protein TRFO_14848 [Tritrichomonas foetus]|uniref:Guanylate cyclase domain-containing protein n=1 Tax=Tritrichomonas foetus TaxID=1144522 RepID=A0A1J4KY94_9EUKA|nr:hypothetical protein TRFO_14848 [Tritrichomonas foetus]|eukprot:OHT14676.1 hypothetical protein TRFO_14848 [Tritrichomonas foetus]
MNNPTLSQNRIVVFGHDNESSRASYIESDEDFSVSTSSYSDHLHYIHKLVKTSAKLHRVLFFYLIYQICFIPITKHVIYASSNPFINNFLEVFAYLSLTHAPDASSPSFIPLFAVIIVFNLLELVVYIISRVYFDVFRFVPKYLCYCTIFLSDLMATIFFPCTTAFCASYFSNVFSSKTSSVILAFIVFLVQILVFIRSIYFLCLNHFVIPYDEMLFRVFYPIAVPRLYSFLSFMVFLKNAINNFHPNFRIIYFIFTFFLAISLFFVYLEHSWINEREMDAVAIAISCSTALSLVLGLDFFISANQNIMQDIMIALILDYAILLIVPRINQHVVDETIKRLKNPKYHRRVKTAKQAFTDLCIGLKNAQKEVLGCSYILKLLKKFDNDFALLVWVARYSMLFNNCPITFKDIIYEMNNQLRGGFNPLKRHALTSLMRIAGPTIEVEMERYNKEYNKVQNIFGRVLSDTHDLFDVIVDENWSLMPKFISYYDYDLRVLTQRLLFFIQRYGNTPHTQFLVELYECFFPLSKELRLFKKWQAVKPVCLSTYLSLFPKFLTQTTMIDSYKPTYDSTKKLLPEIPPNLKTSKKEKKRKQSGPTTHLMSRPYIILYFAFMFLFPIISIPINLQENAKHLHRVMLGLNGHALLWIFSKLEAKLWPYYIFYDPNSTFWIYQTRDGFKDLLLQDIVNLQYNLSIYTFGKGKGHMNSEKDYMKGVALYLTNTNRTTIYYPERTSLYQSLLASTYVAVDFIGFDHIYLKPLENMTYVETENLLLKLHDQLNSDLQVLRSILLASEESHDIHRVKALRFMIINLASLFVGFILLLIIFRIGLKKLNIFMLTIKDTSQTAISSSKHFIMMCLGVINSKKPSRRSKSNQMSFFFIIPILFCLLAACAVLEFELEECFNRQCDRLLILHADYSLGYANISLSAAKCCQLLMTSSDGVSIRDDIKVLVRNFVKASWDEYDNGILFCPLCTKRETYMKTTRRGVSYEKVIYNYLAEIEYLRTIDKSDDVNFDQRLQTAMQQYFYAVDPTLTNFVDYITDMCSTYYNRTKEFQIAIFIFYIILAIATVSMISFVTYRLDKPFIHLSKLLNRLPDAALSSTTLVMLKKSSWSIKNSTSNLDSSLYDKILRTEPDIVIVITRALSVLYFNDAACSIVSGDFQKIKGKNINDVITVPLVDDSGQNIRDILTMYVLENKELAETHKVTATQSQHKMYFNMTILPLFEENNQRSSQIAIIMRDIGDEQRQQNLLSAETQKHLTILQKILPGPIAKKLLKSQRSISMTVEKVTISFCDIVSFTPWCGSQKAEFVVRVLNEMFNLFDEKCNQYETMTKIKCIGDCYMSASGIFNQKPTFGTEMCLFGADMVSQIQVLNQKMGTKLQIRVGAVLGGPISAGVMGIHKPVFDVYGETVNEAQNMESGGMPMRVHINAPLWEICDQSLFKSEEREDGTFLLQRISDLENFIV